MISVIVPFLNSKKTLASLFKSLINQEYPKNDYEIVLVDDGSSDGSVESVRDFIESSPVRVKIVSLSGNGGCFHARNKGIEAAEGNILVFADSDEIAEIQWLRNLIEPFSTKSNVGGVCGKVVTDNDQALILPIITSPIGATGMINGVALGGTGNVAYRRDVLLKIKGFDEDFDPKFRGDSDLCLRVLEAGFDILYSPNAIVYHPAKRHSLKEIWKEGFKRHKDVLLYSKHSKNKNLVRPHVGTGATKPIGSFSPISILVIVLGLLSLYLVLQSPLLFLCITAVSIILWFSFFTSYGYRLVSSRTKIQLSLRVEAAFLLPFYFLAVFIGRLYGCIRYKAVLL